jgi:addiction module HigA family antidote
VAKNSVGARARPPVHPGFVIADIISGYGLSPTAAARQSGLSRADMKQLLAGQISVTPDTALRLGTWLGNGPDPHTTWRKVTTAAKLKGVTPHTLRHIPGRPG